MAELHKRSFAKTSFLVYVNDQMYGKIVCEVNHTDRKEHVCQRPHCIPYGKVIWSGRVTYLGDFFADLKKQRHDFKLALKAWERGKRRLAARPVAPAFAEWARKHACDAQAARDEYMKRKPVFEFSPRRDHMERGR